MSFTGECATSGDIETTLNYALLNPGGMRLYAKSSQTKSSGIHANYLVDPRRVIVRDIRGQEHRFSLDRNRFEFVAHHTTESFLETESIKKAYYAEMERLVKQQTGAHRALVFTHRIRQSYETSPEDMDEVPEDLAAHTVHAERTMESVVEEVREHLGAEAGSLLSGRVRFIIVRRPIGNETHHEPLAVADWQTSSDESRLLPMRMHMSYGRLGTLLGRYSSAHSWYYLRHQTPSEVMLIKGYDSHSGATKFCLYSSLKDLGCHAGAPRRRSIEINALVFG
ncbi:unnamed protein product [Rhizoctonia solani]|uniref:Uncharacterized protein n=1 Tax=Rhizoctonia solani TaxID=456999 RepID=A0A8H3C5X1_9AGAM|nr:unnamed protein product [Rhizoctonia solani]